MDVILIAPMEVSLRNTDNFRENNVENDHTKLSENVFNSMFLKQYRENIGIGALSAYLKKHGYRTKIYNANMENIGNKELVSKVVNANPKVLGISLLYDLHVYNTYLLVKALRNKGYNGHITLGGPFATCTFELLISSLSGVDTIIRGEGEITLLNLVEAVSYDRDWRDINGIVWKDNGRVRVNNPQKVIDDLSILPHVERDGLKHLKSKGIPINVASIYSSRGCKGFCTYCSAPIISRLTKKGTWRPRSPESIISEIEYLVLELGINYLYFCDDNFFGYGPESKNRLKKLAQGIIEKKLNIRFHAEVRVDSRIDIDLLKLLRQAGLQDVLLGIESGSQTTLNRWKKGTTVDRNKKAIQLLHNLNFNVEPSMILVDPLTSSKEFIETVEFIKETNLLKTSFPLHIFNQLIVFPGTSIEKELLDCEVIAPIKSVKSLEQWSSPEDLYVELQRLYCRYYKIRDDKVNVVWSVLSKYSNTLTLLENRVPEYLLFQRANIKNLPNKSKQIKEEYFTKVSHIKYWKNNIAALILDMLDSASDYLKYSTNKPSTAEFNKKIKEIVDNYHFKTVHTDFARFCKEVDAI